MVYNVFLLSLKTELISLPLPDIRKKFFPLTAGDTDIDINGARLQRWLGTLAALHTNFIDGVVSFEPVLTFSVTVLSQSNVCFAEAADELMVSTLVININIVTIESRREVVRFAIVENFFIIVFLSSVVRRIAQG